MQAFLASQPLVRQYDYEYDRSTIVSLFPLALDEEKPTLHPGKFVIPAGAPDKPQLLVVTGSSWWKQTDPDEPPIEIPQPSPVVAKSIVNDYIRGLLGFEPEKAFPALFWVPGIVKPEELKTKYKGEVTLAIERQNKWYDNLILEADKLWARSNHNPSVIPFISKLACEQRGVKRDWTLAFENIETIKCPACGTQVNPEFPVCVNCKVVINKKKAEELKLEFVK